jgi:methylated-DNA-protein-cysteine methyltransferase-like protein
VAPKAPTVEGTFEWPDHRGRRLAVPRAPWAPPTEPSSGRSLPGRPRSPTIAPESRSAPPGRRIPLSPESLEALIVARVREIPKGRVRTYGDIEPAAPRLVGRILSVTRQDLPWQRVVRADGVTPMGERQRRLLRREGVPFRGDRVDMARARYPGRPLPIRPKRPGTAHPVPVEATLG